MGAQVKQHAERLQKDVIEGARTAPAGTRAGGVRAVDRSGGEVFRLPVCVGLVCVPGRVRQVGMHGAYSLGCGR